MRTVRLAVVGAVLAVLSTGVGALGQDRPPVEPAPRVAGAAAPTATTTKNVHIRMSDGIVLTANVTVPDRGCPCPVVLNQTPYRKGERLNRFWQHGYAEVVVDVRGTGSSSGYWDVRGPREQRDGAELVQWVARQKWSNGRVALWGPSYMAINQLLTVQQPGTSAVKALFPIVPAGDSYRDVTFSGGAWTSSFVSWWYALTTGLSALPPDNTTSDPQLAFNALTQHLLRAVNYTGPANAASLLGSYQHALCEATGSTAPTCAYPDASYYGSFYRDRSPIAKIDRVRVPTFVVGGSYDIFQRGTPLVYRGLPLPAGEKKLLIGPWAHVVASSGGTNAGRPGDLPARTATGTVVPDLDTLAVRWFDRWVKGERNGIEDFPNVTTYVLGKGQWVSDPAFPMAATRYTDWHLSAQDAGSGARSLHDGALLPRPVRDPSTLDLPWLPANGACSRNTVQWSGGLSQAAYKDPTVCEERNGQNEAQALTFTTAPVKRGTMLSGPMNLHLFTSSSSPNTSLSVVVSDVAPDGTSTSVTGGSLVGSLRAVDTRPCGRRVESCSVYDDGGITVPWHPYTRASERPMQPGQVYDLQIEIFPTTAYLAPGHRLRVTVMSGDAPHRLDTASTTVGMASGGGLNTFWFGPRYPSRLRVGVVS